MESDGFASTWEPRVGAEATQILRTRAKVAFVPVLTLIAIVASALILSGAAYWAVISVVVIVSVVVYVATTGRINRRLAAVLTERLGMEVSSRSLPPFRKAALFDAWLADTRAGAPPREHSFLGGFVKIRLPPK